MTHEKIKELVDTILKRHYSGNSVSPEEYNLFVQNANNKLYEKMLDMLKQASSQEQPFLQLLEKSTELRPFKASLGSSSGTPGLIPLPERYKQYLSLLLIISSVPRSANFFDEMEFTHFKSNVLVPDFSEEPAALVTPQGIELLPSTITAYTLRYLKTPLVPYYDYCIDANVQQYYMPVGSTIEDIGGVLTLKNGSVTIASGVTHPTATSFPYTSQTVELEWEETFQTKIIPFILAEMSLKLNEQLAAQYAISETNKP